jgi:polyphosphate kinase
MGQALSAVIAPRQQGPAPKCRGLEDGELPLDRDLSLIEFHRRVFDEARDEANPLLERVKFLGIVGTIINEFAVTRYAELAGTQWADSQPLLLPDRHLGVSAHLKRIETATKKLLAQARLYLRDELAPALARKGIHLLDWADLQPKERAEVESYFTESILPLLMPLGFDAARPFPHITGRTTALAAIVRTEGEQRFACLQVPEGIPALVPFHWRRPLGVDAAVSPSRAALEQGFVWLDEVISENLAAAFPGAEIVQVHRFRVLRDAGLDMEVPDGVALPDAVTQSLRQREFGGVVALMVGEQMPLWLVELLRTNLGIPPGAVHSSSDLTDLTELVEWSHLERPDLHDPPLTPRVSAAQARHSASLGGTDIFASIREGDILLHHPYEAFQPVIDFVERAACDPDVLAISTTLYRAGRRSPIVDALLAARRAGKQVRVVVELRARFDEETNIGWARALQDAGAHVVYGAIGFKVHAKLTLVVRRETGRLRRYVHLSSGNYNPATSNVYTDLGLLSCHEDIGSDATRLFNVLTGYGSPSGFRTLLVAPLTLRRRVKDLIEREASWARQGHDAHMILKMNALADQEIIDSLYKASQAGVRIDLIVRGICCLRPGVPGVSDNIRVLSIVGRFLEHSRAWYFHNGGHSEIYIGSADLMPRNLDQRVEVMARLEDDRLKQRVRQEILATYLADNVKARRLMPDGSYVRVLRRANDPEINSQEHLL